MHHLRDEARERLTAHRNGRTRSWALWLRNVILLLAVALLIRYFGTLQSKDEPPATTTSHEQAAPAPDLPEDSP